MNTGLAPGLKRRSERLLSSFCFMKRITNGHATRGPRIGKVLEDSSKFDVKLTYVQNLLVAIR
jgi:hypothetical protein